MTHELESKSPISDRDAATGAESQDILDRVFGKASDRAPLPKYVGFLRDLETPSPEQLDGVDARDRKQEDKS